MEYIFNIRRSTVSGVIKTMEKNNIIIRENVKDDNKSKEIKLTNEVYLRANELVRKLRELDLELLKDVNINCDKTDEEIYNAVNNGITVTLDLFGSNLQYIELPHKTFWGVVPYTAGSNGITKLTVSYVSRDGIGWILKETYITASTASNS